MLRYLIYSATNPFPGYIVWYGKVDTDQPPDGSTVYEYLQRKLAENSDLRLFVYPMEGSVVTQEIREAAKWNPETESLVELETNDITPAKQAALNEAARAAAIIDNLPSWIQVEAAVDAISSLAEAKAFLVKLSRVVYWLAKNSDS
jgi:hypothetical protein